MGSDGRPTGWRGGGRRRAQPRWPRRAALGYCGNGEADRAGQRDPGRTSAQDRRGEPYAPLVELVERVLGRDPDLLDRLPARSRSVLAEPTALVAPAPPLDGALTRHQVIGALRRVLLADAGAAGALLVVDDAHLADEATIDTLVHPAGAYGDRLLVVLAHRPGLAPDVPARGVARLDRAGTALVIELEPLGHGHAAAPSALAAVASRFVLWVPEIRRTSCDLPIFMEGAAEPVVAADAGEVDLAVFRERAQGSGLLKCAERQRRVLTGLNRWTQHRPVG